VPLFVVYDPRVWGANTHDTLDQALTDVRKVVKHNIIAAAMQQQSGFSRGRMVGRMEQQAKSVLERASKERQRRQEAMRQKRWDTLNAASLEKRLIDHGVIRLDDIGKDDDEDNPTLRKPTRQYTPAMVEIARQCVADENKKQRSDEHESSASD
jgi:hypothetical protein